MLGGLKTYNFTEGKLYRWTSRCTCTSRISGTCFRRRRLMSEEIAWAAGLYEGEGTVFAPWSKRDCTYHSPKLQINMTDEDIIDRFGAIIQVGTSMSIPRC